MNPIALGIAAFGRSMVLFVARTLPKMTAGLTLAAGTGVVAGLWNSITGLFGQATNQGGVDPEDEETTWEQLQGLANNAGVAAFTAGILGVTLIFVLGWKSMKKMAK
jgi:hypothetical protein